MKFMKLSKAQIRSVRFCLSYDPLKGDLIAFKMNNISSTKRMADTDVVNGVTCTRQSIIRRVGHA